MVKAIDFWNYLCNDLDYRFFSGTACPGLSALYSAMSPDFMHYVPAVNERIGLGLVSGAYMAGLKCGLLIDMNFAYDLTNFFNFSIDNRIPFLMLGSGDKDSHVAFDFPRAVITTDSFKTKVDFVVKNIEKENVPGLIVFKEGVI